MKINWDKFKLNKENKGNGRFSGSSRTGKVFRHSEDTVKSLTTYKYMPHMSVNPMDPMLPSPAPVRPLRRADTIGGTRSEEVVICWPDGVWAPRVPVYDTIDDPSMRPPNYSMWSQGQGGWIQQLALEPPGRPAMTALIQRLLEAF